MIRDRGLKALCSCVDAPTVADGTMAAQWMSPSYFHLKGWDHKPEGGGGASAYVTIVAIVILLTPPPAGPLVAADSKTER